MNRFPHYQLLLAIAQSLGARAQPVLFLQRSQRRKFSFQIGNPNSQKSASMLNTIFSSMGYESTLMRLKTPKRKDKRGRYMVSQTAYVIEVKPPGGPMKGRFPPLKELQNVFGDRR